MIVFVLVMAAVFLGWGVFSLMRGHAGPGACQVALALVFTLEFFLELGRWLVAVLR